jgi:chitinase
VIKCVVDCMAFATKLKGTKAIGAYWQTWSDRWASDVKQHSLANIDPMVNVVFLAFARPNSSYKKGQNSFEGTGLEFCNEFKTVVAAIRILKERGVVVMLSVGGGSYPFDYFTPYAIVDLANDLGVDGIDIDWEDNRGKAADMELGPIIHNMRQAYSGLISAAVFSVGAYSNGELPPSDYTGMCIAGLKSNGHHLDFVNIMSYDAGPTYDPKKAFKAYRDIYKGPLLLGLEVGLLGLK